MATYRVYLTADASLTIKVDVPDDLTGAAANEAAIEKAFEKIPSDLCAQCSGWGERWTRDIGEWDVERDSEGYELPPERHG